MGVWAVRLCYLVCRRVFHKHSGCRIDVSNPASPKIVGSTDTGTAYLNVADIKVVGKYTLMWQGRATSNPRHSLLRIPKYLYSTSPIPPRHICLAVYRWRTVRKAWMSKEITCTRRFTIRTRWTFTTYPIRHRAFSGRHGLHLSGTCKAARRHSRRNHCVRGMLYKFIGGSSGCVQSNFSKCGGIHISLPATSYPQFLESKG